MTLLLNTYCISMLVFMLAYLLNQGEIATVSTTLLVIGSVLLTFGRELYRNGMMVAGPIAGIFVTVVLMLIFFLIKHLAVAGSSGISLALKITIYHFGFLAGLLIGFGDTRIKIMRAKLYVVLLFFLPLVFFWLFFKGASLQNSELFVFNRNPFAGYMITSSALLLGFAAERQLVTMRVYILVLSVALFLNSTLGALLAFFVAVLISGYWQRLMGRNVLLSTLILLMLIGGGLAYTKLNPGAFSNIEVFNRLDFMVGLFSNLFMDYSGSWLQLDMATSVRFAPSDELDMSAMFRILHWLDILQMRVAEGLSALWIGGGTGWIEINKHHFKYNLSAHNEYVRIIVEQGLLHALVIFGAIFTVILRLRNSCLFLPILTMAIFFGSENALNDFVFTTMFLLLLGYAVGDQRRWQRLSEG